MTVLSAQSISKLCLQNRMVWPYNGRTVKNGKSYGLSSAGYDVRVETAGGDGVILTKGGFVLAATFEHFIMPGNIIGFVHDKSSWARKGLAVQNTVIEPGWRGHLTLELTNHGENALHIAELDPIAQIVFQQLDQYTDQPYGGKYQDQQRGPQEAKDET